MPEEFDVVDEVSRDTAELLLGEANLAYGDDRVFVLEPKDGDAR